MTGAFPVMAEGGAGGMALHAGPGVPEAGALLCFEARRGAPWLAAEVGNCEAGQAGSWGPLGSHS